MKRSVLTIHIDINVAGKSGLVDMWAGWYFRLNSPELPKLCANHLKVPAKVKVKEFIPRDMNIFIFFCSGSSVLHSACRLKSSASLSIECLG